MFSYLSQRDTFYSSDIPPSKIISFFVCKKHGSWMEPVLDHSNIHKADHVSPFTPPSPTLCADVLDTGCILPQRKDNILPQKTEMPGNGSPPLALWGWRVWSLCGHQVQKAHKTRAPVLSLDSAPTHSMALSRTQSPSVKNGCSVPTFSL